MKRARWIVALLSMVYGLTISSFAASAEPASDGELQRLLFARLLLDADPEKSRLGARSIAQLPDADAKQSLTDLTAEHLMKLAEADPTMSSGIADTVGWHVNALATNVGRYRGVLSDARQRFAHPRLHKRIDAALQSPDPASAEQYHIRQVDIASIKADLDQQWAANRRRDRSAFARIQPGTDLAAVLSALGSADDVSPTTMRVARKGRTQMLTLHYAQSGMVLFKIYGTDTTAWQVFEAVDETFDVSGVYLGKYFGTAQAIASFRGTRFRDHLIYSARTIVTNADFLPVLEQRLVSVPDAADKFEKDAMLRCLGLIYRYRSDDAAAALRRIEKSATDEHVEKDARSYATKLELRAATDPPAEESKDESESDDADDEA